ncbi:MAG: mechanosensitive ion channel domain-containing protein [Arenimonas sp.]
MESKLADFLNYLDIQLFKLGKTEVTLGSLLTVLLFVVAIWWLAAMMEKAAIRLSKNYCDAPWKYARVYLLSRMVRYIVWILGTVIGLNKLGVDLSSFALLGGAVGIGLGFGLQNIFSNFISGIIILLERSLKVGDFVDLASGVRGHVREIGMRYTRVTTNDAIDVLVPNSEFINGRVTNWTLDDDWRRMRVPFGVAYGTPKEQVREACKAAAMGMKGIRTDVGKEPDAWLISYGDSAMNFELVFWADRELSTHPASCHARLMWSLDDELQKRNIEIPFPQRDVHIRTGGLQIATPEIENRNE